MQLTPHPSTPLPPGWSLSVRHRVARDVVQLIWLLCADMAALRIPAARPPARRDELWRHTCFELFVADATGDGYREFNFAPSSEWAAYQFTGYRQGMAPLALPAAPRIERLPAAEGMQLQVALPRAALGASADGRVARRRCALAAVIEHVDGAISYLALAHPAGRPDFHHAGGFTGVLEA